MTIYMMTTRDKYELPLAVSETISGLARMAGEPMTRVYNGIQNKKRRPPTARPCKWHIVEIEDDE